MTSHQPPRVSRVRTTTLACLLAALWAVPCLTGCTKKPIVYQPAPTPAPVPAPYPWHTPPDYSGSSSSAPMPDMSVPDPDELNR